jgi:hypothetical protein
MTTEDFKAWLLSQDDTTKLKFAINWSIAHSVFNVACNYIESAELQEIDWYDIYKSKGELIVWERDMVAAKSK